MQTIKVNVTIRRDKETGRPNLFFVNQSAQGYWIECYDRIGQHSEASRSYMQACKLEDGAAPDAQALVKEWSGQPDAVGVATVASVGRRLGYPRGLRYLGA